MLRADHQERGHCAGVVLTRLRGEAIVQGQFSVAPSQTIRNFCIAGEGRSRGGTHLGLGGEGAEQLREADDHGVRVDLGAQLPARELPSVEAHHGALCAACQMLPRPVLTPKQLGLGFNKTNQQLCVQF